MKKRLHKFALIFIVANIFITAFSINTVFANPATLYEFKDETILTKDTTYEKIRQITSDGFRNIHVLRVPVSDPYVKIGITESLSSPGLKETVKTLVDSNGAIAGVNGDFFGLKGSYSAGFGPIVKDGVLKSVSTGFNNEKNEYASFYIEDENNPFILYTRTEIDFLNDGDEVIEVFALNKLTDMVMPIAINREFMSDTSALDERFSNIVKIVVDNGYITYLSEKGETVEVPENGYIIAIKEDSVEYFAPFFVPGQTAELHIRSGIDFSKISQSIGGAGRVLLNGEAVNDGLTINGRQPRTALGISEDQKQIILVTIDGRGLSIGANHSETAEIMKNLGAYNAMHLDGGGSTTMVVKTPTEDTSKVVNKVSDGSQRKVINAVSVFDNSEVGEMSNLILETSGKKHSVFQGIANRINVYATDDYYHVIDIPQNQILWSFSEADGHFEGEYFVPHREGKITLIASYMGFAVEQNVYSKPLSELKPSIDEILLSKGESANISFNGIDTEGNQIFIPSGVSYEVVPPELAKAEFGTITAENEGSGYLRCTVGNINKYIPLYIGSIEKQIYSFEGGLEIDYSSYPDEISGTAIYASEQKSDKDTSLKLTYGFDPSEETQASYINFPTAYEIPGRPSSISLDIAGDKSDLWFRAKIKDSGGNDYTLDLSKGLDWDAWKTLTTKIPAEAVYPISLEKLYVASISTSEAISGSIYFDNLTGTFHGDNGLVNIPESDKYMNLTSLPLQETPLPGSFDITIVGNTQINLDNPPETYETAKDSIISKLKSNSKAGIYAGPTDFSANLGITTFKWTPEYAVHGLDNVEIVNLTATNGGIYNTYKEQWAYFPVDLGSTEKDHIIINIDKNPLTFDTSQEIELFNDELVKLKEKGKNIFVISSGGNKTTETAKDGIKYIHLANLINSNNTINSDFKILRLRITGNTIRYELQGLN